MKRAMTWGILGLTGVMTLGTAAVTHADDRDRDHDRDRVEKRDHLTNQEMVFLKERAQDDVNNWKVAEYAVAHAGDQRTRDLGKAIIEERRTDLRDIQKIAKDHDEDLKVPDEMTAQQRLRLDTLTAKGGRNFDRDWTKDVVSNYETTIPQLKRFKDQAVHTDVRDYAAKNVSMFEDHLKQARDVQKEVWK